MDLESGEDAPQREEDAGGNGGGVKPQLGGFLEDNLDLQRLFLPCDSCQPKVSLLILTSPIFCLINSVKYNLLPFLFVYIAFIHPIWLF